MEFVGRFFIFLFAYSFSGISRIDACNDGAADVMPNAEYRTETKK